MTRSISSCLTLATACVFGAATGCYAYRPVALAPVPGSLVRIVFTTSTTVVTFTPGPDSVRRSFPAVLEASGHIQAAAGDTVVLRLGELRTASGPVPDISGQVALLPAARIARIEERRFQAGTTVLAGVGLSALALATFLTIIILALTKGF